MSYNLGVTPPAARFYACIMHMESPFSYTYISHYYHQSSLTLLFYLENPGGDASVAITVAHNGKCSP